MDRALGLVMSDSHIPERAEWFPRKFLEIFEGKRYDFVVHAGDLVSSEVLEFLRGLSRRLYVVMGNMDYLYHLPESERFEVLGVPIGVVHGDQVRPRGNIDALTQLAKYMEVSVLISGHTHSPFVTVKDEILHVNPGSVTGVWGGGGGSMRPSFVELEVAEGGLLRAMLYELEGEEVVVRGSSHRVAIRR